MFSNFNGFYRQGKGGGCSPFHAFTLILTLNLGEGENLPTLALNADISITVTAMTLKFHDFPYRITLSVWAEKVVK